MRTWTIAFLLGVLAVQFLPRLPAPGWQLFLMLPVLVACFLPGFRRVLLPVIAWGCGFCWACQAGQLQLDNRLPAVLEGEKLHITGQIVDIPVTEELASRFVFVAHTAVIDGTEQEVSWKLRLKWYGKHRPQLHADQKWQLFVKLKRPHGLANPGAFDFEHWLFANRYAATGYVRDSTSAELFQPETVFSIDRIRETISRTITRVLSKHPGKGIAQALAIGDRSQMSNADWQLLTRTGTNHLVAISGLHIGLVSGFIYWLVLAGVRRVPALCILRPAQDYAAIAAILAAIAYAALAGFSIPTRRAVLMISVFMLAILMRRRVASFDTLCLAMLVVLLHDPLAVLAPGFWLSFAAVTVIIATVRGTLQQPSLLSGWSRVQIAISITLLPLLVLLFGRISLVAPLANMIAIPWVSFISVPLVLSAMALSLLGIDALWSLAATSIQGLTVVLDGMATWAYASVVLPAAPAWAGVAAFIGTATILLPRGLPGRWLGLLGMLPMLLLRLPGPTSGEAMIDILDVGQGLSVVVRTHRHTLVYDTGPAFGGGLDAGKSVVLPYLEHIGVTYLDMLIVSHADRDHTGGTQAVLDSLPVHNLLSGQPGKISNRAVQCTAGQGWEWDGVRFDILSPSAADPAPRSNNDRSCVLRVVTQDASLLIPGDIEAETERKLLSRQPAQLAADILIAPHHGSRSSSTRAFIDAVRPVHVVYSVGYRNRYHLPNAQVVQRYDPSQGHETAHTGRLQFHLSRKGITIRPWRTQHRKYWHLD